MKARPPDFPPPQPAEASAIAAEDVAIAVDESTKQLEDQCGCCFARFELRNLQKLLDCSISLAAMPLTILSVAARPPAVPSYVSVVQLTKSSLSARPLAASTYVTFVRIHPEIQEALVVA